MTPFGYSGSTKDLSYKNFVCPAVGKYPPSADFQYRYWNAPQDSNDE